VFEMQVFLKVVENATTEPDSDGGCKMQMTDKNEECNTMSRLDELMVLDPNEFQTEEVWKSVDSGRCDDPDDNRGRLIFCRQNSTTILGYSSDSGCHRKRQTSCESSSASTAGTVATWEDSLNTSSRGITIGTCILCGFSFIAKFLYDFYSAHFKNE
jgi:hypothetical protein